LVLLWSYISSTSIFWTSTQYQTLPWVLRLHFYKKQTNFLSLWNFHCSQEQNNKKWVSCIDMLDYGECCKGNKK
jgi:hypothetical protein